MENLSDMYYLIRFIFGRIFVYLRDIVLHELQWFPEDIDELDATGTKTRGAHPFTRRAIADFVAFFTICAFFGSFVILSTKCAKDDENNYNSTTRPATPESEGEPLELLEDEDCTISQTPLETARQNPWGDTIVDESDHESVYNRGKVLDSRAGIRCSRKNYNYRGSIVELRSSNSQHSQSTQTNERIIKRATSNRDWLIRKTRSGQIYGKYPM